MSRLNKLEFVAKTTEQEDYLCRTTDCPSDEFNNWTSCASCCIAEDDRLLKLCQDLQISKNTES